MPLVSAVCFSVPGFLPALLLHDSFSIRSLPKDTTPKRLAPTTFAFGGAESQGARALREALSQHGSEALVVVKQIRWPRGDSRRQRSYGL